MLDKIDQFDRELSDPATPPGERLLALKFLMHFVGDVDQPLHVAEHDNDKGGNLVPVLPAGKRASESLHLYWDVDLVDRLGSDAEAIARGLLGSPSRARRPNGPGGTLKDSGPEVKRARPVDGLRHSQDYRRRRGRQAGRAPR